jgi:glycosyltransferase involved in cell wall biosynthesis
MKIGFDAKRAFLNRTGLGNYSRGVIEMLQKEPEVNSLVLYTPKLSNEILSQENLSSDLIEVKTPPALLSGPLSSTWRSNFVTDQIKKDGLDLYHGLSNELPKGIENTGIPSVVTVHDLIFLHYPEYYKLIDRKIYETKVKHACDVATRIIATSEQTADDLVSSLDVNRAKISVVYQGCDMRFSEPVLDEDLIRIKAKFNLPERYILSVGTVEERKNSKILVEAIKSLNVRDLKLVLVGRKTNYSDLVLETAKTLGLEKRVMILDKVDFADLPAVYQLASVFVLPSLMEGFGIPVLEAMSSKVPVIVSKNSCLAEVCDNAGIQINPKKTEEIASAISSVLEDDSRRQEMIRLGHERTQRFSDETISKDLMLVYRLAQAEYLK